MEKYHETCYKNPPVLSLGMTDSVMKVVHFSLAHSHEEADVKTSAFYLSDPMKIHTRQEPSSTRFHSLETQAIHLCKPLLSILSST